MIKKNKLKLIICSILILLPMIFGVLNWNELPDTMATHWGIDGQADDFSTKPFAVFAIPCFLLLLFWGCMLIENKFGTNQEQNKKAFGIIFWMVPAISLAVNGAVYLTALGFEVNVIRTLPVLLGFMFMFIGNYMPKCKQNKTLGVKIKWTLNNEENWNATHRFAGKLWFFGGFLILLCVLLPVDVLVYPMLISMLFLTFAPVLYSYVFHKKTTKGE